MDTTQIVILGGVLLLAATNLATLLWVTFLNRLVQQQKSPKNYTIHLDGSKFFADIDSEEVKSLVHDKLVTATAKAAKEFEASLQKTLPRMVSDIDEVNTKAMKEEFDKYRANIQALSAEAMQDQFKMQQDVAEHRADLIAALDAEVVTQYKKRMTEFDSRLSDVIGSYMVEILGQEADLGAQMPYLLRQLEAQKAQIKKDMLA